MTDELPKQSKSSPYMVDGDSGWGKSKGSSQPQLPWKAIAIIVSQLAVVLLFCSIMIRWFFVPSL